MTRTDLWHGSALPHRHLAAGRDGGIHLGTFDQAVMRNPAFLHRVAFDTGRARRSVDRGGDWASRIAAARRASCTSMVYLNRWEGVSAKSLDRIASMRDHDRVADAAWRRAVPECQDSWIALHEQDVRVLEIVPGAGMVTLWHGTTAENAQALLRDGFTPGGWRSGGNGGRRGMLYLSTDPEDARWFSNELGCDHVLKIRLPAADLVVDPEDGIGDSVWEEFCQPVPGKLATVRPIQAHRISLLAPRPEASLETDGPSP